MHLDWGHKQTLIPALLKNPVYALLTLSDAYQEMHIMLAQGNFYQ